MNNENKKLTKSSTQNKSHGPGGRGPGRGPQGTVEKPKDFKGSMSKLLKYLSNHRLSLTIIILCALASTVFSIISPKILGNITTEVYNGVVSQYTGGDGIDFVLIGKIGVALIVIYLISAGFSMTYGFIMSKVAVKVSYKLRTDIENKIHKLPISYYDKNSTGDVLSRITNDVDVINQLLSSSLTQMITAIATLIGIIVMMLTISWKMTIIAILTVPISGLIIAFIVKKSQGYFDEQQKYIGKINGKVEESYGSHTIIKAFNGEEKNIADFEETNKVLYNSAWKSNFFSGLMMPILSFVTNIGYVAVCVLGGYLASAGAINVGDIQAFLQYTRQFSQPFSQVSQLSAMLQQTAAASERIFTFLDEPEESIEQLDDSIELEKVNGVVDFNNVNFGYLKDKTIINNFNCHVKAGQKVAIVGPTGAGKTTIVKLLMRFYPLNSGSIELDGHNINSFYSGDLRNMFGMVLQDAWLYNSTIMENIRYGQLTASDDEVIQAAKAAQVDKFVSSLPGGYSMELNEDATNLSQGQKQLLTIARAILADHKVLILDEATSSVDTRTEVLIQKAMDNLMEGRTSFIIAHRLSTIKNADIILVMNDGDIIEQGSHQELMKQEGFYANLYKSQFE